MNYKRVTFLIEIPKKDDYIQDLQDMNLEMLLLNWLEKRGYVGSIGIENISDEDLKPWAVIREHLRGIWQEVKALFTPLPSASPQISPKDGEYLGGEGHGCDGGGS